MVSLSLIFLVRLALISRVVFLLFCITFPHLNDLNTHIRWFASDMRIVDTLCALSF